MIFLTNKCIKININTISKAVPNVSQDISI